MQQADCLLKPAAPEGSQRRRWLLVPTDATENAFSLCDSSLLFQMRPHPLLGAGLSADLDCPQLLWVLAKSNAQCLCGLFAAGKQVRGAEQQAYQQGELLRFPS